jgi:hypothetical protein
VTGYRVLPLVAMLVAVPFAAGAQFGGPPGSLPGGPGMGLGGPPAAPPPKCQALLAIRDELQRHWAAIEAERLNKKADVKVACRLFRNYAVTYFSMSKMLDSDGPSCGVPPQVLSQVRESHAKAQQMRKQVCDAAASGPSLLGPNLLEPSLHREKPWPPGDYWLPGNRRRGAPPSWGH